MTPTLGDEILYILGSKNNNAGLSPQRARELTASVLMQIRLTLFDTYQHTLVPSSVNALVGDLRLLQRMDNIPLQVWEVEEETVDKKVRRIIDEEGQGPRYQVRRWTAEDGERLWVVADTLTCYPDGRPRAASEHFATPEQARAVAQGMNEPPPTPEPTIEDMLTAMHDGDWDVVIGHSDEGWCVTMVEPGALEPDDEGAYEGPGPTLHAAVLAAFTEWSKEEV